MSLANSIPTDQRPQLNSMEGEVFSKKNGSRSALEQSQFENSEIKLSEYLF